MNNLYKEAMDEINISDQCLRKVKSMNNNNADTMIQETDRRTLRGELALIAAVLINSFGVVLMLYSGAGISAISSVPFAF